MTDWQRIKLHTAIIFVLALLPGCTRTITKEVVVEVRVPVPVRCMGERPAEVKPLREVLSRDEWDRLTTDQRANLTGAQAIDRKTYGERMTDAAAGCP